jgi:hypothetical protein
MGRVVLPPAASAGTLKAEIEWSGEELAAAVALLREMARVAAPEAAQQGSGISGVSAGVGALRVSAPAEAPRAPAAHPHPPPQQQAARAPSFLPPAPPPAAAAPPPPPQQQLQQQQQRAPAPPPAPPAAAPYAYGGGISAPPSASWQRVWRADPSEHSNAAVSALFWRSGYDSLPGGDGHAGWLVSATKGLLNLWECSPSAGVGEPAVTVMHAQARRA